MNNELVHGLNSGKVRKDQCNISTTTASVFANLSNALFLSLATHELSNILFYASK